MSERVLFAEITVFKRDFRMKVNENNEIDDLKTRQYRQHRQQFQRKVKKQNTLYQNTVCLVYIVYAEGKT